MVFDVTKAVGHLKYYFFPPQSLQYYCVQESFENIKLWLQVIDQHSGENVKKLLIGNKCDLTYDRFVGHETAKVCKDCQ